MRANKSNTCRFRIQKAIWGHSTQKARFKKKNTRNTTENIDLIPPKDFELILMWHIVYIKTRWQNRHNTKKKKHNQLIITLDVRSYDSSATLKSAHSIQTFKRRRAEKR